MLYNAIFISAGKITKLKRNIDTFCALFSLFGYFITILPDADEEILLPFIVLMR